MPASPAITVEQTEDYFRHMLDQAGVDLATATVAQVWPVFQEFARVPVADCPEVEVLVEWGVYNFHVGRDMFQLGFVRQFSREENGEYAGMEQLHCISFFESVPALAPMHGNMWSFGYADLDAFFREVEAREPFQLASLSYRPREVRVMQWAV